MAFRVFKLIQNIHFKAIFWTIPISRKTQDCSQEPRSGEQGDQNFYEQGHPGLDIGLVPADAPLFVDKVLSEWENPDGKQPKTINSIIYADMI